MKERQIKELYKNCSSIITEKTQEIHNLILGQGNYNAKIMILSEAPSSKEEEANTLFIGKAGENLDNFLKKLDLTRDDVYITNIVKYRPYKVNKKGRIVNRSIEKEDIDFFLPYLIKEMEIIAPRIIVTLGNAPLRIIMEDDNLAINEEVGKLKKKHINDIEYRIFPIYHPAAFIFDDSVEENSNEVKLLKDLIEVHVTEEESPNNVKEDYKILPKKGTIELKPYINKKKSSKLKTIIIYGGDGYADDPTLVALDRISNVLTELNVRINRLDLYKGDLDITSFLEELKTTHAVVIATTVEWFGIGRLLQSFLDKCWKFGHKELFEDMYLFGVVISKQAYERDAYNHIIKSWEILGGVEGVNICSSINDSVELETNKVLLEAIDKKAEDFYRIINSRRTVLPTSIKNNRVYIEVPLSPTSIIEENLDINKLLGEEGEVEPINKKSTLISNYDEYIEKQQKDIEDIANLFKKKISNKEENAVKSIPELLMERYTNKDTQIKSTIQWLINDKKSENTIIILNNEQIKCEHGVENNVDVTLSCDKEIIDRILEGKLTIQRAFMTGELKAKGNFTILYKLDTLFNLKK